MNIYGVAEILKERGWNLNNLQFPSCIHLCCTMLHTENGVADKFIKDVSEAMAMSLKNPSATDSESAAIYGMTQTIPDRGLVSVLTRTYLDSLYVTKAERTASSN